MALIIPSSKSATRGADAPSRGSALTALVTRPPIASRSMTPASSWPYPAVPAARMIGFRNWSDATVTASRPSVMRAVGTATHASLVAAEVFGRRVRDRAREHLLVGGRLEIARFGCVRPETDLHEHGGHEGGDQHLESRLLHPATRSGMHPTQLPLNDFGEIR